MSLEDLRAKALQSLRTGQAVTSASSSHAPNSFFAEETEENAAFVSENHQFYELARALASSDDFSNISNLLRWIPEKSQYQVLATKPKLWHAIREELYSLLRSGVLNFEILKSLGLSERVLQIVRDDFPEFDDRTIPVSEKKRSAELDRGESQNMEEKSIDCYVIDISDDEWPEKDLHESGSVELEMDLETFVKTCHLSSLEQNFLRLSMGLVEKKVHQQSIVDTQRKRQDQVLNLEKEKSLLENRRQISSARILKYTELITAYRSQINQILSKISDLEKTRLQLQANVDRSDMEAKACILSQESDEAKILDLEKKTAELSSLINSDDCEKDRIQELILVAEKDLTSLRSLLDSATWETDISFPQLVDLFDLDNHALVSSEGPSNGAFFSEYSANFLQVETDLVSFRDLFNLPFRDFWKDQVLSFCLERRRNMHMCQSETMNGACSIDKCQDLHFADLQIPADQFSLKFALQSLDANEKNNIKDQVSLISANSVEEYLDSFLKIPIVKARFESLMDNQTGNEVNSSVQTYPQQKHSFITPVLSDWARGTLDFSKYPKIGESTPVIGVEKWISKAVSVLPSSPSCLESSPHLLKDSILVCLDGLQFEENAKSESLRSFFLDLLQAFTTSVEWIRELFDSAINDLPNSLHLKWMYYVYEKDASLKKMLLLKIMDRSIQTQNSLALLNCLAQLLLKPASVNFSFDEKSLLIKSCVEIIRGTCTDFFNTPYPAIGLQKILNVDHYAIFVLLLICSLAVPSFPEKVLFLSPPHSCLCIPKLFLIPWTRSVLGNGAILAIDALFRLAIEAVDTKKKSSVPFSYRCSIVALVRNRLELLQHCSRIQPKSLASVAHHYYVTYTFAEFLDIQVKYLQIAGLNAEAFGVYRNSNNPALENGEFSLLINQLKHQKHQDVDFLKLALSDSPVLIRMLKDRRTDGVFSTYLEAIVKAIQSKDLKIGKEALLKVMAKTEKSTFKLFLWSQLLFVQVCCGDEEYAILESCRRMVLDLPHLTYPFASFNSADNLVVHPVTKCLLNWDLLADLKKAIAPNLAKSIDSLISNHL